MSWIQVRATLPVVADSSPFVEIFRTHGIDSTEESGPLLAGCLADVSGAAERVEELKSALKEAGVLDVESHPLEEQNWDEVWKQFFHPQRIGRRIVVRPTWEEFDSSPDDVVITLDPGQAFGTGDHPTTRLCLVLLEKAFEPEVADESDKNGPRVADIGCGSGILSIAACLLGANRIDAVDIDPTSVEVARENAELNQVAFNLSVSDGTENLSPPYDIVISNIISAILMRIAPNVAKILQPGGLWIVSGILTDNWPLVHNAALREGFTLEEKAEEGDWVAATLRRLGGEGR